MRRLFASLSRFIAPLLEERCTSCASPVQYCGTRGDALPLCAACAGKLQRRSGGYCPVCGNLTALPHTVPSLCGPCLSRREAGKPQPWNALFFFAPYEGYFRELILRCKAGQELPLARLLGGLLASHPGIENGYDAVVPIPLHGSKLRKRGFNQALEIAKPLAGRMGVPLLHGILTRTAKTRRQSGLSLGERKRNVREAFAAGRQVRGMRILLVDDIATTCATLEEATNALKRAGAMHLDAAVLARTPEYSSLPSPKP